MPAPHRLQRTAVHTIALIADLPRENSGGPLSHELSCGARASGSRRRNDHNRRQAGDVLMCLKDAMSDSAPTNPAWTSGSSISRLLAGGHATPSPQLAPTSM